MKADENGKKDEGVSDYKALNACPGIKPEQDLIRFHILFDRYRLYPLNKLSSSRCYLFPRDTLIFECARSVPNMRYPEVDYDGQCEWDHRQQMCPQTFRATIST